MQSAPLRQVRLRYTQPRNLLGIPKVGHLTPYATDAWLERELLHRRSLEQQAQLVRAKLELDGDQVVQPPLAMDAQDASARRKGQPHLPPKRDVRLGRDLDRPRLIAVPKHERA
ncbi:MAG: hypothetical protein JWN48_1635 [Myxococcaceae bacterium]|nr:hypothetical protein [Myxococcaceae bacterium]